VLQITLVLDHDICNALSFWTPNTSVSYFQRGGDHKIFNAGCHPHGSASSSCAVLHQVEWDANLVIYGIMNAGLGQPPEKSLLAVAVYRFLSPVGAAL
jgi:hypothetical protein